MEGDLQTDTLENNAKRATVLPSRYNAAEHDLVTPVKDQNPYGTCWAFSALSACETSMIRKGLQNTSFDLSEFHFAYFFFHTQEDALGGTAGDCTLLADPDYMDVGGADACTMFALSKWTGAAAESLASYPYEQLYTPSSSLAYQDVGHLQNVRYVNGSDTASIKRLILQYGSVSAPLCVNLKKYYSKSTGAYYCNNNTGTNHQLTIVGWDDDYSTANFTSGIRPSKKGAWIAKNSYGEDFGNDGYIYISYQDNSLNHQKKSTADSDSLVFAYDMENSDNYSHNYQYDGSASCTYMPIPSGSSLSNIFIVSGNPNGQEKLKSVSFALASENIQYAIQIYKNPTAGDPTSGIAVLDRAQSGVTTYCGYYTIPLNTEIVFNQGDRFSVVISFASPTNQTLYAFIDKSSSLESLHFVSSAEIGQSYYRTKANGWMDISYQQINNRIKAFTENTTEAATEILANVSALPKSSIRKIKSSRCSSLRLSWNAVQYADGYQIFRSTSRKKGYTLIADTKKTSYSDNTVVPGRKYYYRIRAYARSRYNDIVYSPYSQVKNQTLKPEKAQIRSLKKKSSKTYLLSWRKVPGADGYEVFRQISGKKWELFKRIKRTGTLKLKLSLASKKDCFYRVRAYKKTAKENIYGPFSKKVKISAK